MKKIILFISFFTCLWEAGNTQVVISSDITTNTTWTNDNIYLLTGGFIYVTNNAILTIQPGTLIKGNASSLVITRGAKIMAQGTPAQPIVFTSYQVAGSRAAADWGGVLLLGKGLINDPAGERLAEGGIDPVKGLYGGTDPNDNSGVFSYCRIEFAGIAYQPNNETNGLTCSAVGSATTIDHVQVSFGGDDSFEFFGGNVNCKYLVTYRGLDDEFDTDYGFTGKLQFCLSLRDSSLADVSGSNGFESDNDATGSTNAPTTKPIISNMTIVGPQRTLGTVVNSNYKRGAHLRRSTSECIYNSLIMGYPVGLKLESQNSANNANSGSLQFKNNIIAGCPTAFDSAGITGFNFMAWFNASGSTLLTNVSDLMLTNPYHFTGTPPNFQPLAGSPALTGASFSSPNLNNSFFTTTTYRGAFDGINDWTTCWTNWDPQNTPYTTAGINYLAVSITPGDTSFCEGDTISLTANTTATNYSWSNGGSGVSTNVTTSGSYTVTVFNATCSNYTTTPTVVTVNPLPVADFTIAGSDPDLVFINNSTGGSTYDWDFGDGGTATTMSPTHTFMVSGNYTICLTVTSASGCIDSSCQTVTLTSLESVKNPAGITLYPNPSIGKSQLGFSLDCSGFVNIEIMNAEGKLVSIQGGDFFAGQNSIELDFSNLPCGIYSTRVETPSGIKTIRTAITR